LARTMQVRYVYEKKPGLGYARIAGAKNATFNLILFCDDDNLLSNNYLNIAWSIARKHPKIGMFSGYGIPLFEENTIIPNWFEEAALLHYAIHKPTPNSSIITAKDNIFLYGAGLIIRKDIFQEIQDRKYELFLTGRKGDSIISGEDNELCALAMLLEYNLLFDERLTFKHKISKDKLSLDWIKGKMSDVYSIFILSIYQDVLKNKKKGVLGYFYKIFQESFIHVLVGIKKHIKSEWTTMNRIWYKHKINLLLFKLNNYSLYKNTFIRINNSFPRKKM
ncbi:MAG: glycosyltransferase, partial [Saprospiraceae bacterium]